MKILITALDIFGAVLASKMTGDLRQHFKWMLVTFFVALALAYIIVRP